MMGAAKQVSNQRVFMDQDLRVDSAPPEQFFHHPQTGKAQKFLSRFFVLGHGAVE
jgi:ABC-type polar amino acid transport system ATPase subunit